MSLTVDHMSNPTAWTRPPMPTQHFEGFQILLSPMRSRHVKVLISSWTALLYPKDTFLSSQIELTVYTCCLAYSA
jgi:hypothetical protein